MRYTRLVYGGDRELRRDTSGILPWSSVPRTAGEIRDIP